MIVIDAPISFLFGAGLALALSKKNDTDWSQGFMQGYFLQTCVLSPVILFFLLRFPDWEWHYLFNAKDFFFEEGNMNLGILLIASLMAGLNLSYVLGFKLSQKLIKNQQTNFLISTLLFTGIAILAFMGFMYKESLFIGSLNEFTNGNATLIFLKPEFLAAQCFAGIALALGVFIILRKNNT